MTMLLALNAIRAFYFAGDARSATKTAGLGPALRDRA